LRNCTEKSTELEGIAKLSAIVILILLLNLPILAQMRHSDLPP
jgi:hypothetical protein